MMGDIITSAEFKKTTDLTDLIENFIHSKNIYLMSNFTIIHDDITFRCKVCNVYFDPRTNDFYKYKKGQFEEYQCTNCITTKLKSY